MVDKTNKCIIVFVIITVQGTKRLKLNTVCFGGGNIYIYIYIYMRACGLLGVQVFLPARILCSLKIF
jgi:hypothetical protein